MAAGLRIGNRATVVTASLLVEGVNTARDCQIEPAVGGLAAISRHRCPSCPDSRRLSRLPSARSRFFRSLLSRRRCADSPRSALAPNANGKTKFRAIPEPARMRDAMQRLAARPHHVGSPYGKANAEWLHEQFTSYGWDAHIERFDVLFPTPKERVVELVAPTRFSAKLQEPTVAEDPTSRPTRRAAADVQRILDRWRRHGADGLRELRRAGRLRGARAARRLGQRRDRHRALRRLVARHQAEGRRRTRRDRLPHLLRSARRRLRRRRRFPEGTDAPHATACSAAASPTCRSIRAIRSRRASARRRTPSVSTSRTRRRSRRSPCCPFHTATRSRCSPRSADRSRRTRGAAGCRSPIASAPGPARVHLKREIRLEPQAALRRHREVARLRPSPTSGSFAATITTPG